MVGAGPVRFAVWNYVIAKAYKSRVEVNPKLLGPILGCSPEEITDALGWLCRPDGESRNKEYGGARMIKEGQFQYFVPSWVFYHQMRDEDDRRAYNRRKQAECRARKKESEAVVGNGDPSAPIPPIPKSDIPEAKQFERPADQDPVSPPCPTTGGIPIYGEPEI